MDFKDEDVDFLRVSEHFKDLYEDLQDFPVLDFSEVHRTSQGHFCDFRDILDFGEFLKILVLKNL